MVDWLYHHVEGFTDRREARKYSSNLLKAGYIRHTVNKITFSEQCYYVFGDLCGSEWTCPVQESDNKCRVKAVAHQVRVFCMCFSHVITIIMHKNLAQVLTPMCFIIIFFSKIHSTRQKDSIGSIQY